MLTLEQRHQILSQLNFALLRNPSIQGYAADYYDRDFGVAGQFTPELHTEADIWPRCDRVEESHYKVMQVQQIVADLLALDAQLQRDRGSNYALRKAGDLAWGEDKTAGLELQQEELINRLRYLLDLPQSPPKQFGGTLGRS